MPTISPESIDLDSQPLGDIALTGEQSQEVQYSKYESQDPNLSDTDHSGTVWTEEFTAHERLGLNEDHGCIIRFHGTQRGEVGITREGGVLTLEEVDLREQNTGQNVPRYNAFDFRVAFIRKTDGPLRRLKLQETMDQQRADGEKNMMDSIAEAFQKAIGGANGGGVAPQSSNPNPNDISEFLSTLNEDQRRALVEGGGMDTEPDPEEPELVVAEEVEAEEDTLMNAVAVAADHGSKGGRKGRK